MAEAEYSTTARIPVAAIWDFVQEMDNWAHFLRGYQSHEKESETDSVWTLKGDLGVMSRTLKVRVYITEWAGPERVSFELKGLNEPMEGGGSFQMEPYEDADVAAPAAPPSRGLLTRLLESIVRFFLNLFGGAPQRAATADAGPGAGMARLSFKLRLDPGGPMAPMVNAMIKPIMQPTAEELANQIMAHLENEQSGKAESQGARSTR